MIPLLVDTVGEARSMPIVVHGTPETLRILRSHIFNWLVWPDFSSIPDRGNPFLRFQEMRTGESTHVGGGRQIVALPALHFARLPSTSPAHAARNFEAKLAAWQAVRAATRIDDGNDDRMRRSTLGAPGAIAPAADRKPSVRPTPATRAA